MRDCFFCFILLIFHKKKIKSGTVHNSVNQLLWAIGVSRVFFPLKRPILGEVSLLCTTISACWQIQRYTVNLVWCWCVFAELYEPIHIHRNICLPTEISVDILFDVSTDISTDTRHYLPIYRPILSTDISTHTRYCRPILNTIDRCIDQSIGRYIDRYQNIYLSVACRSSIDRCKVPVKHR